MQTAERLRDKGPQASADFPGVSDSPPAISCRCGGGTCRIRVSRTVTNPGRRFYTCPRAEQCKFFKWCDEITNKQISSRPVSRNPICPCGSGPCRKLTKTSGLNAGRSYFVCGIKEGFGACAFFQWEDAQMPSEPEEGPRGSSSPSSGVSGSVAVDNKNCRVETTVVSENGKSSSPEDGVAENISPANGFTLVDDVNQVTDGTHHVMSLTPDKECPVSVAVNNVPVEVKSNPLDSRSNSLETVPSVSLSAEVDMNQDAVHVETREEVLDSLCLNDIEPEKPMEVLHGDQRTNGALSEYNSKESYELEVDEAMSVLLSIHEYETTSNEANSEHIREFVEHQPGSGEIEHSFADSPALLDLIEQYQSEKFRFDGISVKCVEAFSAFVGTYKRLKSLHERAYRLRKLLLQTEKQIACCEAETLEFAASVQEVSGEMNESQKRMQETAEKLANEMEFFKQR